MFYFKSAVASALALISYVFAQSTIILTVIIPSPVITSTITVTLIILTLTPTPTSSTTIFETITGNPVVTPSSTSTSTQTITVTATQTVRPPVADLASARPLGAQYGGVGYTGVSECAGTAECSSVNGLGDVYLKCVDSSPVEVVTKLVFSEMATAESQHKADYLSRRARTLA